MLVAMVVTVPMSLFLTMAVTMPLIIMATGIPTKLHILLAASMPVALLRPDVQPLCLPLLKLKMHSIIA